MTNVTKSDIITQEEIRDVVLRTVEENLLYRMAFGTSLNVSGMANDTLKIPVEGDTMGEPVEIKPGMEFPLDEEDISTISVTVAKYGVAIKIAKEAIDDSKFDVIAMQVEKKARKMQELLNTLAHTELAANLHANSPIGTDGGPLVFDEIIDARTELVNSGFMPNMIIVDPKGEADLIKSAEFQRATDLGDDVVLNGAIGRVAGMSVFVDNSGKLGDNEAYVIDNREYGVEVVKDNIGTDEWEDKGRQARIFNIWWRGAYKTTRASAAIKVVG